ncbi:hypothetical protein [Paenibacillus planticolens]|uniref:Thioredoxin n=1 Tax=Paenibacillus planticolens TaxID=2654976 RepID=A0ABX1ZIX9_9BACL|nr:hypothetical protein [Paenibacillus planticolens]NOV00054.1 hypothetical protein [Paenibacillus planticolens]
MARKTFWFMTGTLALLVAVVGIGQWNGIETTLADSADSQVNGPNEITGSSSEAIAELKRIIHSDDHNFVYLYKSNCGLCTKLEPLISTAAEKKGVKLYRFNLTKYGGAKDLKNEKGLPLVHFYKELPAVAYYNKGWLIAWIEGDESEKKYEEFYEHFQFGDDDGHEHGDGHEHKDMK